MITGVVADRRFADHSMGPGHVESPARVEVLNRMLEEDAPASLLRIDPQPATLEELGWVHERGYIDLIAATSGKAGVFLDADTSAGPETYETARLAAGGFLRSLDAVMEGRVRNAFSAIRPPGHHAEASRAMGFCIFNNVAIGAEHLLRKHGLERVLIVDWDLHHGNGTEHAFYPRREVLYFSTHQVPLYPGTGSVRSVGAGAGEGFNLNVPLLAGKGDDDYLHVFEGLLAPVAAQYRPEFILVSAGFDIGIEDPLGGMQVTGEGFGRLASALMRMAEDCCGGRLAFSLEGGYDLRGLRNGVREVLARLSGPATAPGPSPALSAAARAEIDIVRRVFSKYWNLAES